MRARLCAANGVDIDNVGNTSAKHCPTECHRSSESGLEVGILGDDIDDLMNQEADILRGVVEHHHGDVRGFLKPFTLKGPKSKLVREINELEYLPPILNHGGEADLFKE